MFQLSTPVWELVVRALVVYGALILLLRLGGKRQVGQLAPFDFVLLLILSNAVQNSMNAGDNSLIAGLISALTLVLLNFGVGVLAYRNPRIENLLDGEPEVLIRHGQVFPQALRRAQLTRQELYAALRRNGCREPAEVELAMLEINGAISVLPLEPKKS